eukprot:TRINITY_DN967_c0_g4_i9.p1 TRINITY_DN967_c0_g4~~TRINITY_DN967_c0_g4_i9.p1  ORF type:complete len:204 (+),score=81.11 TRINITY_DN967_c0_g4_i9:35-646(+)
METLTLQIAEKIAEKRRAESLMPGLRMRLAELREEVAGKQQTNKELKVKIGKELASMQKKMKELAPLQEALKEIEELKEKKMKAAREQVSNYVALRNMLYKDLKKRREEIAALESETAKEKSRIKNKIEKMQIEQVNAIGLIEDAKGKVKSAKQIERERAAKIKEKSQVLKSLITDEGRSGEIPLKISHILKAQTHLSTPKKD